MVKIEVTAGTFPSGDLDMNKNERDYNQYIIAGCGLVTFAGIIVVAGSLILMFARDWQSARYPGSIPLSNHSNYSGLPYEYRWDNSYRSSGNFTDIYNWYSITFDLGAETRAMGKCTILEGSNARLAFSRHISVSLCGTDFGQMIYVTRSTSLLGRVTDFPGLEDLRRSVFATRPHPAGR
jgi:hypothetical protein